MQSDASRGAAAEDEPCDALTVLPLALPHALALRIWVALPADVRLRCREVCPAWRDALGEPRMWKELDLTPTSGVAARLSPALLLAAAARAGGQLERLLVTDSYGLEATLLAVVAANAATFFLRLLHIDRAMLQLSFLFAAYRIDRWYWEVAELLRKLALTSILALIAPGSARAKWWWACSWRSWGC